MYCVALGCHAQVSISSPLEDTSSLSVEFVTYDERQVSHVIRLMSTLSTRCTVLWTYDNLMG